MTFRRLFDLRAADGEPVDQLSIPWRIHYLIVAVAALNIGMIPLLWSFTDAGHALADPVNRASCVLGISIAPLTVFLARRWKFQFHHGFFAVVLFAGVIGPFSTAMTVNELHGATLAPMLTAAAGAAYYLRPRVATSLIALATVLVLIVAAVANDPDVVVQASFFAIVLSCGASMLGALRRLLIGVVKHNRELSEQDALTGAANIRCFERRLNDEIERHARGGTGFALIGIDLDDFKQVNDRFSHSLGDEVLVASVKAIRSKLTSADLVVRRGGDEFLVVAPGVEGRDLDATAAQISAAIANARFEICPDTIPTATTAWVEHRAGETADELLKRADAAVHDVKSSAPSTRRGTVMQEHVAEVVTEAVESAGSSLSTVADSPTESAPSIGKGIGTRRIGYSMDPMISAARLAWRTAGIAAFAFCSSALTLSAVGISAIEMTPLTVGVLGGALITLCPLFWWMSTRNIASDRIMHILVCSALVMITVACIVVGRAGPMAAEMYLMVVLIIPALMRPRLTLLYIVLAAGGYIGFIVGHGYHPSGLRLTTSLSNVAVLAGFIGITRTWTVRAAARSSALAGIDALTGLPNLRRLRSRLRDELRRSAANGERFGLIMFDLDDFKAVNDFYSHSLGDRVLIDVGEALKESARQTDMPARRGGDEFALVVTDCSYDDLEKTAERIEAVVVEARLSACPEVAPTASIGSALWRPGDTIDDLLARADEALHDEKIASKRRGDRFGHRDAAIANYS